MKTTRKPLTAKQARSLATLFTFGTFALALFLLPVNWQLSAALTFAFMAGWIAANYWRGGNQATGYKEVIQQQIDAQIRKGTRPTRESIAKYNRENQP
jgi:hypothetical protein